MLIPMNTATATKFQNILPGLALSLAVSAVAIGLEKIEEHYTGKAWLEALGARVDAGDEGTDWVANVCLLKNHATQAMQFCADAAVQILGGMGYMRGTVSERVYREVKVMMIGGGAGLMVQAAGVQPRAAGAGTSALR